MSRVNSVAIAAMTVLLAPTHTRAIDLSLSGPDIQRALSIARGPAPDRSRFHDRYIVNVNGAAFDYVTVERVEVITEFRRLELIAEDHVRLNDTFGRAGSREPEAALRQWRGRLSIVAHLQFRTANRFVTGVPPIDILMGGSSRVAPIETHSKGIYSGADSGATLIGGTVEGVFDAKSVAQASLPIAVRWNKADLAHLTIDFGQLE